MGNRCDGGDIWYAVLGVADCLDVDRACVLVHRFVEFGRVTAHHPLHFDLELLQVDTELVEGTTVYCPQAGWCLPFNIRFQGTTGYNLHQLVLMKLWPGSQHCVKAMN